jgi:hypothetical protein
MLIDELHNYLFDGQPHPLALTMESWLTSSRRFAAFVNSSHNKIRKKIRTTQDQETLSDLRFELETAYLLLQVRQLSLIYEPPHCGQPRCPDFAVTFTTSLTFMVEVTRIRTIQTRISAQAETEPEAVSMEEQLSDTIADTVCDKLGQLLPQHSNVFIVGTDDPVPTPGELNAAMLRVQQRVERNDPTFWERHRFRDRADFFRHYYRLSEVLVRRSLSATDEAALEWVNPQGKYPLPSKVRTALLRSHSL